MARLPALRVPKEGGLWDRLMQERLKLLKAIRAREAAEPALLLPEAATRAYDNAVRWRVQNVRVAFGHCVSPNTLSMYVNETT